jgi:hypothetical protein
MLIRFPKNVSIESLFCAFAQSFCKEVCFALLSHPIQFNSIQKALLKKYIFFYGALKTYKSKQVNRRDYGKI